MPSPFPGMNPYLERADVWPEFHSNFLNAAQVALTAQVRPKYVVRMEQRLYLHEPGADERRFFAQADVLLSHPPGTGADGGTAVVRTPAPAYGSFPTGIEKVRVRYLEIRDRQSNRVVTVIELLSPTNKYAGPDRDMYVGKRRELFTGSVHFVELDLLRGGPRLELNGLPPCDYYAAVSRVEERPGAGIWPWRLRDPLPTVPVPLAAADPSARLDLKVVLDQVYDAHGYADFIYTGLPEPQLAPADAAWAAGFVPAPPG